MKKILKILASSVFIALNCLIFQTAHGTKNFFSEPGEQGVKQSPVPRVSDTLDIEDAQQRWEQGAMKKSISSIKHEQIYQKFLEGILVYRPNQGSDVGRIDLPIASLVDPLEGTFDLSRCNDVRKYLSISTGYRKGMKEENANKLEIWLTPRFLVEKEINGSAQHYQEIFPSQWSEKYPVGIFWSWGDWDNMEHYTYLTTNTMDELGNNNLYEKWCASTTAGGHAGGLSELIPWVGSSMQYFMFIL